MRAILLGLLTALFLTFSLTSVYAESEDIDVSIGFDFAFAEQIDNSNSFLDEGKRLSGTVISSEENILVSWDIQNSTGFRYNWGEFNVLSDNLTEISDGYFSLNWEVFIKSNDYYSCSCQFNIYVEYANQIISQDNMPFFILNEMYIPDSNYSLLVHSPKNLDWINGDLTIDAQINGINDVKPSSIHIYLKRYVTFTETCDSGITYSGDNVVSPEYTDENRFTYHLDMNTKPDGWYELIMLIPSDNSIDEYDVYSCFSLRLNNLAPVISISEDPYDQFEGNSFLIIDASMTEDPIWSEDEMYFIWTCTQSGSTDILIQEGYDEAIFELEARIAADYTVKLEVMDQGGISSTKEFNFSISNMLPSPTLLINGVEVFDGEELDLRSLEGISIDGSKSVDTDNDITNLRCIWSIDTVTLFEGCNRDLIWPEEKINSDSIFLRLDVMDDDGAYSSVNVKLLNPNASAPLPYHMIILFISSLFLISSIFYRFRKDSDSSSIPKWTKGK